MQEYLEGFRQAIEKYWDEQTISPKFLPIDPTKPASLGQCAPTSQALLTTLRRDYPEKNFTLAIGEVRQGDVAIIPFHVWVVEAADSPKENRIIDVNADQSGSLEKVVYDKVKTLADQEIYYIAYDLSPTMSFIHPDAAKRGDILLSRYSNDG